MFRAVYAIICAIAPIWSSRTWASSRSKNIAHPIRAFRLRVDENVAATDLETETPDLPLLATEPTPLRDGAAADRNALRTSPSAANRTRTTWPACLATATATCS